MTLFTSLLPPTYLTLIDNYDRIPVAGAVFIHGSRRAWHNDDPSYDNAALLLALDIPSVMLCSGYHNLRCDWSLLSTCAPSAGPQGSIENTAQAVLQLRSLRAVSDRALPGALQELLPLGWEMGWEEWIRCGRSAVRSLW
ncbi:hypothetical protein EYZ11_012959 [Aspergillus tanneri]|uniref:Uncharacterized protein n=1 Tax=Aspergillus tanneri TaxID=1220188 RepID=A0A4S3J110_9EURO|nr:uncharacterized protein ATNIH1004_000888 [Aspergillus tanneri]KAA8651988.1 hypothetical protein ATNIH1004_000888 [Aspergillus tanneri]THC87597.1 hypothetical protein EYZ11_012959 [Aspergillus tanneri]